MDTIWIVLLSHVAVQLMTPRASRARIPLVGPLPTEFLVGPEVGLFDRAFAGLSSFGAPAGSV